MQPNNDEDLSSSLVISNIEETDEGIYICKRSEDQAEDSVTIFLRVNQGIVILSFLTAL